MNGSSNLSVSVELITPQLAHELLEASQSLRNREIKGDHVHALAAAMRESRFHTNGESIVIDEEGRVLDGQHRLLAIIEAQVTVELIVVRGVPPSVIDSIDTGRGRSAADVIHMAGFRRAPRLASAARDLYFFLRGTFTGGPSGSRSDGTRDVSPSNEQIHELIQRTPDLVSAVDQASDAYPNVCKWVEGGRTAFWFFALSNISRDNAAEFFGSLESGANLPESHPVLLLRQALIENASSRRKRPKSDLAAFTIKAWNAFHSGATFKMLKHSRRDRFPIVDGRESITGAAEGSDRAAI
ncbi:MAG: hypothetical protein ACREUT_17480 [Steroidobacteraceae bacterium]